MRFIILLFSAVLLLSISGCKLTGVKGEIGDIEVEAKEEGSGKGKFCPPGQEKKGKC